MGVIVVGVNHRTVSQSVIERLTFSPGVLSCALERLAGADGVTEAVLLSTCNRVEVYTAVAGFQRGRHDLQTFLSDFHNVTPSEFRRGLYSFYGENAVRHLFRVAAGLDSMILGEDQILGQVRRAYRAAEGVKVIGRCLQPVFQDALRTGRLVRRQAFDRLRPPSVATAAVSLVRASASWRATGERRALVIGAGELGGLIAKELRRAGAREMVIASRTLETARRMAGPIGARVAPLSELGRLLAATDVAVCATGSAHPVVDARLARSSITCRRAGETGVLLLVDLAVPRDVAPEVRETPGISVVDMADVRSALGRLSTPSPSELRAAERLVAEQLDRHLARLRMRAARAAAARFSAADPDRGGVREVARDNSGHRRSRNRTSWISLRSGSSAASSMG